jgi:phage recombination protein Bet
MLLLRNVIAKGCTEPEFKLLMYMANTYGLDPLLKQIWAVKRNESQPALIFAGRDGMLAIAHRSGHFDGMQSGVIYEGAGKDKKPVSAWCEIWRNDMSHSFKTEVPFSEYNTGFSVWKTNPSAMILKVAEAVCLRKAFSVSGLYAPEEIDTEVR